MKANRELSIETNLIKEQIAKNRKRIFHNAKKMEQRKRAMDLERSIGVIEAGKA